MKTSETASPTLVEILEQIERYRFGSLFRVVEARLRHRCHDGSRSEPMTRIDFERGPAVAVLVVDTKADAVVLVRQFRYSAYVDLLRSGEDPEKAWLLEVPAGILEGGEEPMEVARREVLEETGYRLHHALEPLGSVLPSPGASSEVIHLFLAMVTEEDRVAAGGGVADEHEDIEVVHLPIPRALELLAAGEIRDAKTVVALQQLALRRAAEQVERAGLGSGAPAQGRRHRGRS